MLYQTKHYAFMGMNINFITRKTKQYKAKKTINIRAYSTEIEKY